MKTNSHYIIQALLATAIASFVALALGINFVQLAEYNVFASDGIAETKLFLWYYTFVIVPSDHIDNHHHSYSPSRAVASRVLLIFSLVVGAIALVSLLTYIILQPAKNRTASPLGSHTSSFFLGAGVLLLCSIVCLFISAVMLLAMTCVYAHYVSTIHTRQTAYIHSWTSEWKDGLRMCVAATVIGGVTTFCLLMYWWLMRAPEVDEAEAGPQQTAMGHPLDYHAEYPVALPNQGPNTMYQMPTAAQACANGAWLPPIVEEDQLAH